MEVKVRHQGVELVPVGYFQSRKSVSKICDPVVKQWSISFVLENISMRPDDAEGILIILSDNKVSIITYATVGLT